MLIQRLPRTAAASLPFEKQSPALLTPAYPGSTVLEWLKSAERKAKPEAGSSEWIDPLFLFQRSLLWHKSADTGAGWDLVNGLRSSHRHTRLISSSLLAATGYGRLLVRDLRKLNTTVPMQSMAAQHAELNSFGNSGEVEQMNTPYGLEITESCLTCNIRKDKDKWFCSLSPEVLKPFSGVTRPSTYPAGALLFVEGQMARGAYVLCAGKVKLSTTSREGKVLMLKMANAGEVLGLSAAVSGTPYELTAETAVPCQVNFVERETLVRLMERYGELGLHAAQALSKDFQSTYRDIQELVLARSSAGKLARLLLSWTPGREKLGAGNEVRIRSSVTHEEMAQMIGSSRETVTRLLSDLKKKELIRLEGATLVIRNRTALEALAA